MKMNHLHLDNRDFTKDITKQWRAKIICDLLNIVKSFFKSIRNFSFINIVLSI